MTHTRASVPARIGLLGNPSDGYGGRVVACTIDQLRADVEATGADEYSVVDSSGGVVSAPDVDGLAAELARGSLQNGADLLAAAAIAMQSEGHRLNPVRLQFSTTIPREVGLSGSSAIVIAALRALRRCSGGEWHPVDLARVALAAEVDVLSITAGPQDRVVQALGGLVDMDFARPWHEPSYRRLASSRLPPLLLAWNDGDAASSTVVHSDVRARWEQGDADVRRTIAGFADLGARGAELLARADPVATRAVLADLVDQAFELRRGIWSITEGEAA